MEKLKDKKYWELILMRALKTFVQTLISTGGITAVTTLTDLMAIDWKYCLIASLGAGLMSLINNIIGTIPEYDDTAIYERQSDVLASDEEAAQGSGTEEEEQTLDPMQ